MPNKNQNMNFFITGLIIIAMSIISGIIVALIFLAPTILIMMAGFPAWPMLLITIPVGIFILGWAVLTIGRFKRKK
jgi:hypothetical protein